MVTTQTLCASRRIGEVCEAGKQCILGGGHRSGACHLAGSEGNVAGTLEDGHSLGKLALAVQARYVSGSLLAEGNEGTRLYNVVRTFATCNGRESLGACGV